MSEVGEMQKSGEMAPQSIVMKFGGTSLEDAVAIRRAAQIVRHRMNHRPVIVVSALSNVTDELLEAGRLAANGQLEQATGLLVSLQRRHEQAVQQSAGPAQAEVLRTQLEEDFGKMHQILKGVAGAAELTPRLQDPARYRSGSPRSASIPPTSNGARECSASECP